MDWGTLLGLLGLGFALYSYLKTRDKIALVLDYDHKVIIEETFWPRFAKEHVRVFYKDIQTSRVVRTYVLAWNGGKKTLTFEDGLKDLSLRFPDGGKIFNFGIRSNDDEANNARAEPAEDSLVKLHFDYLRSGEAVVYFVDHAADQKTVALVAHEKIRNLIKRNRIDAGAFLEQATAIIAPVIAVVLIFIGAAAAIFSSDWLLGVAPLGESPDGQHRFSIGILVALMCLIAVFGTAIFFWTSSQASFDVLLEKFQNYKYGKSVIYYQDVVKGSILFRNSKVS